MTYNFRSISKVLQSYQDNGWVIMKGCVQWNPDYDWKHFHLAPGTARSVGQCFTYWVTPLPAFPITGAPCNQIRMNEQTFKGATLPVSFLPLFSNLVNSKRKEFAHCEPGNQFFLLRVLISLKYLHHPRKQTGVTRIVSLCKYGRETCRCINTP